MYTSQKELVNDLKAAIEKEPKLATQIIEADSAEEIKNALKMNGVELTQEEAEEMYVEVKKQGADELDVESLDSVSGGGIIAGATIIGGAVVCIIGFIRGLSGK